MQLRDLLTSIAADYGRALGPDQPAVKVLASAEEHLADSVPVTHLVKGSTGVGGLPFVPWVAIFDPDETTSAQRGMYVVYLFAEDKTKIYLSLNQGTDDFKAKRSSVGTRGPSIPDLLRTEAAAIRARLKPANRPDLLDRIDLGVKSRQTRPRNYEAANILAKAYDASALPANDQLQQDLDDLLDLYGRGLDIRQQLALSEPGLISSRQQAAPPQPHEEFKPTDGSDYYVKINASEGRRSRKHVALLKAFAEHLEQLGYTPSNQGVHPRDLTASKGTEYWLIEVKMVRGRNGQQASREAVAQLLEYRRFCYPQELRSTVRMLAVFSESIGQAFVEHLETLEIASVWMAGGTRWTGSPSAVAAGLC